MSPREWLVMIAVIIGLVLLPAYVYTLSKSASMGKAMGLLQLLKGKENEDNGKEEEEEE